MLSGSNLRYVWRGREWTVDSERARRLVISLSLTAIFLGLFAGLLLYAFSTYSRSGNDAWMLITALIMFCAILVVIFLIRVIRSKASTGVYYKRFAVRPSTIDSILIDSVSEIGLELIPEEPARLYWDPYRTWDIHGSYAIKGMDSRVNVVRKFRIRLNQVRIHSLLEMGPKGIGEDEMLDRLAEAIDSAYKHGQEDDLVDFGEAKARFRAWNAGWFISVVIMQFWFAIFLCVRAEIIQDETLVRLEVEYHITLILMVVTLIMSRAMFRRIVAISRQVTTS